MSKLNFFIFFRKIDRKMISLLINNRYVRSVLSFFKYLCIICVVPPIINYAAINREISAISNHGLPYDVGLGQKLFLSCKGTGVPTSERQILFPILAHNHIRVES